MRRPLPRLRTDEEAEAFVADADLTEYDLSAFRLVRFELLPKSKRVSLRVPEPLLKAVKERAPAGRLLPALHPPRPGAGARPPRPVTRLTPLARAA
jgi:predicted DNA binding CopG/RHH family protein